ncbi:hypothetical protein H0266_10470 [Halobacillus locisalis]|uniref:Uncharacterized protein n=1 Tax=Halobacillus locisalis TaxID=220753 RepID=A0A838CTJ9_9BACI|nr:hypothetical protein [Halobacillus locisalis]MBA2175320.1 hypothetical protein [Halobacillus locisalis]
MLTLLTTKGSIATEEEMILALPEEVYITTTPYITKDTLFHNISSKLDLLESNSDLTLDDISAVQEMMNDLPAKSEEYFECRFRVRSLKKTMKSNKSSTRTNKNAENIQTESIESFLINEGVHSFINLGAKGREWVASRLKYENVDELKQDDYKNELEFKMSLLNDYIDEFKKSSDSVDLINIMKELKVNITEDEEVLHLTLDKWINQPKESVHTLTQVDQTLKKLKKQVYQDGITKTTITEQVYLEVK